MVRPEYSVRAGRDGLPSASARYAEGLAAFQIVTSFYYVGIKLATFAEFLGISVATTHEGGDKTSFSGGVWKLGLKYGCWSLILDV